MSSTPSEFRITPAITPGLREEQPTDVFPLFSASDDLALKVSSLMENTADWIYFKDLNSRFTLVSASLIQQLTGTRKASVLGKTDSDFINKECAEKIYEDDNKVLRTGVSILGKVELVEFYNGGSHWMSTSKMPLKDDAGKIVGLIGISRDITKQKLVEQELDESNKALFEASRRAGMAEVATNVIHNVGNVLNSINVSANRADEVARDMGFDKLNKVTQLLRSNLSNPEFFGPEGKVKHVPDYIESVSQTLRDDNQTLRAELAETRKHLEHVCSIISRQQEHASNLQFIETVEMSELVDQAIRMNSDALKKHNITIARQFEPGIIVETDKHRVLQIVVNLIRNAKHACVDSGNRDRHITVSVRSGDDATVLIEVKDNGVGIEPENLVKVFNHGFTTRVNGHGFGLHSGGNSAKQLHGSLTCQSDGPGTGATFILTLPLQVTESAT